MTVPTAPTDERAYAQGLLYLLRRFILANRGHDALAGWTDADKLAFTHIHDRLAAQAGEASFVAWAEAVTGQEFSGEREGRGDHGAQG